MNEPIYWEIHLCQLMALDLHSGISSIPALFSYYSSHTILVATHIHVLCLKHHMCPHKHTAFNKIQNCVICDLPFKTVRFNFCWCKSLADELWWNGDILKILISRKSVPGSSVRREEPSVQSQRVQRHFGQYSLAPPMTDSCKKSHDSRLWLGKKAPLSTASAVCHFENACSYILSPTKYVLSCFEKFRSYTSFSSMAVV